MLRRSLESAPSQWGQINLTRPSPRAAGVHLVWRPSRRALQGPLDAVIHDECVRVGGHPVGVADLYSNPALHATAGHLTPFGVADGFHPDNAGHAAIAQRIYVTLR